MTAPVETVETQVVIEQGGEVAVGRAERLTQIVDVDQPRYEEDFPIDWVKLGCAVKRKVKAVADLIYNDDRADLAEIINNYGPADIDLTGLTADGEWRLTMGRVQSICPGKCRDFSRKWGFWLGRDSS